MIVKGISVVICCYNSAWVIEDCLKALINQNISMSLSWEVIIVNNGSTDNTEKIAYELLKTTSIDFKIIDEPIPGLLNARKRGVKESKYSNIIFCDDDNILCHDYVNGMYQLIENGNNIGAYGGKGIAFFESTPDDIILDFLPAYAIGSQKNNLNYKYLYGAGICIPKRIIEHIYDKYDLLLSGRCGKQLLSGDDSEMVKAILLENYAIAYTDELCFTHKLKTQRLSFKYLCNMYAGFGLSAPVLTIYDLCIENKSFYYIYRSYIHQVVNLLICMPLLFNQKKRIKFIHSLKYIEGVHFWKISKLYTLYKSINRNKLI